MSVLFSLFFAVNSAWAALQIPQGLGPIERESVTRHLALPTLLKSINDPYPLGGYWGAEVSLVQEFLPTEGIGLLGARAETQPYLTYSALQVSKGLYYGFDFSLQWIPMGQNERVSGYGGALRWGLAEWSAFPLHLVVQATGNSMSFQEKVNTINQTLDFITAYSSQGWSFFGGFGFVRGTGLFVGGASGVNTEGVDQASTISTVQVFAGGSLSFKDYFVGGQYTNSGNPMVSLKLGLRL